MKRIILILTLLALLIPCSSMAEIDLTTPIDRPSITKFRVLDFRVVNNESPYLLIMAEMGYDVGNTFDAEYIDVVRITNKEVIVSHIENGRLIDRERVARINDDGIFEDFPPAYQQDPASVIAGHINQGTFGGQPTATAYIELILRTLRGL